MPERHANLLLAINGVVRSWVGGWSSVARSSGAVAVSELHVDRLIASGVRVLLKRDDLIHPEIPGNKWRKLKDNLTAARQLGRDTLLTFGGAYSNHIRATAAVGYYGGFTTLASGRRIWCTDLGGAEPGQRSR